MKEKIISKLSTGLTIEQVRDKLQNTVENKTLKKHGHATRYPGRVHTDFAFVRDVNAPLKSFRLKYIISFASVQNKTILTISNDSVSRRNDSYGYIIIMTIPIGVAFSLAAIYSIFKTEDAGSFFFLLIGLLLISISFFITPHANNKNYIADNDKETKWLCNYLSAEAVN